MAPTDPGGIDRNDTVQAPLVCGDECLDEIARVKCETKPCRIELPTNVLTTSSSSAAESLQSFSYAYVSHSGLSSRMALIKRAIQFLREHSTEISETSSALTDFFVSHQHEVEPYTHAMGIPFSSIQRNLSTASMTDFFSTLPKRQAGNDDQGLRGLLSLLENRHGDTRRSLSQGVEPLDTSSRDINDLLTDGDQTRELKPVASAVEIADGKSLDQPESTPMSRVRTGSSNGSSREATESAVDMTVLGSPMKARALKSRTTSWSESEDDEEGITFTPKRMSQQNLAPKFLEQLSQTQRSVSSPLSKEVVSGSSGSSPASSSPSLKRTRTLTNTSSLSLQAKLLDFLAEPFQDKALQPITRAATMLDISSAPEAMSQPETLSRGGSWLPSHVELQPPMTTPNLASSKSTTGLGLLSGTMARYSATQVVVTTSASAPYEIRAVNDVACLVFGVSRAELRNTSILNMAREDMREELERELSNALTKPSSVAICGMVIPVVKGNRQESLASIWVKKSQGALIWVAEEVAGDHVELAMKKQNPNVVETIGGDRNILFGQHDWASYGDIKRDSLIRSVDDNKESQNGVSDNDSSMPGISFSYTTKAGPYDYPCIVRRERNIFHITSLPHMSGMVMLDSSTLQITDYNAFFVQYLFGYSSKSRDLIGKHVSVLLPQMSGFIDEIKKSKNPLGLGMVYPEHFFRRMASSGDDKRMTFFSSIGIDGRHMNGAILKIDCQLRVASTSQLSLWISFSRHIQEAHEIFSIPSQLPLLNERKRTEGDDSGSDSSGGSSSMAHSRESSLGDTDTSVTELKKDVYGLQNESQRSLASTRSMEADGSVSEADGTSSTLAAAEITELRGVTEIGAHKRDRKFSDFRVVKKMGEGAYGRVVLARYPDDPACLIVVKSVVKDRILVDTWVRDRKLGTVSSEIKILAALNQTPHPNIVGMVDFLEDDECYHIEMEAHGNPGIDLFDLIELNPQMPEAECKSIFRQIVSAVAHLHGLGIVHRDIKDENIILDGKGLLKLIDFGSAAYVKNGPFDVFVGTIDYAAPEVLSGNPYLGRPQDVWALGILLYTIVYKENPFYNVDEILEGELRVPFVMSEDCLDLIKMILNRDVNKRPTIEEIKAHKWLQE
ncbi:Serine/threonine-protein kinase PSK1 [Yarrowia sp. C11]|nr:Serine/threonine-protein kinase PSK1 [Yarrowia sp. C11]KAG5364931.1 Serine/threonine-protein kinase PSK1 [Yarrowia sp. E02]